MQERPRSNFGLAPFKLHAHNLHVQPRWKGKQPLRRRMRPVDLNTESNLSAGRRSEGRRSWDRRSQGHGQYARPGGSRVTVFKIDTPDRSSARKGGG
jgi:hypothetical protein